LAASIYNAALALFLLFFFLIVQKMDRWEHSKRRAILFSFLNAIVWGLLLGTAIACLALTLFHEILGGVFGFEQLALILVKTVGRLIETTINK